MKGVEVRPVRSGRNGRLHPHYLEDAKLISVDSDVKRPWPYGINIDSTIILDIDVDGILAHFDVHAAKRAWRLSPIPDLFAENLEEADLKISDTALSEKAFHLPVQVLADESRSRVSILFGSPDPQPFWVVLGPGCLAQISSDYLTGFFLKLSR